MSIFVDTYGTGIVTDAEIVKLVMEKFDLRPGSIVKQFEMQRPIFQATAWGGHFGREEFLWEKPVMLKLDQK